MEKFNPTYGLEAIKADAAQGKMEITHSASVSAFALGLGTKEMLEIVQTIQRSHFIKSMTAKADHTLWQDVYNVPSQVGLLYIKFTFGMIHQFKLLSFKEK